MFPLAVETTEPPPVRLKLPDKKTFPVVTMFPVDANKSIVLPTSKLPSTCKFPLVSKLALVPDQARVLVALREINPVADISTGLLSLLTIEPVFRVHNLSPQTYQLLPDLTYRSPVALSKWIFPLVLELGGDWLECTSDLFDLSSFDGYTIHITLLKECNYFYSVLTVRVYQRSGIFGINSWYYLVKFGEIT
jgi:hypothetical protein